MIKHPERAGEYLDFYIEVRANLRGSVEDGGEEMLAALINRNALESVPTMRARLIAEDAALAEALAAAPDEWHDQIAEWALKCRFARSGWWRAIESRSRELRSAKAV
jgi:hypothetical protein